MLNNSATGLTATDMTQDTSPDLAKFLKGAKFGQVVPPRVMEKARVTAPKPRAIARISPIDAPEYAKKE